MDGASIHAGRGQTLAPRDDGAAYSPVERPQTWASAAQVYALVEADSASRGVRFYPQLANHVIDVHHVLLRRAAPAGDDLVSITSGQVARDLYPDCITREAQIRKRTSVRNWLKVLYRVGLVERVETRRTATGADGCLVLRLLPVPAELAPEDCQARRRRETRQQRQERRLRPFCRISGQKGVNRYVTALQDDEPSTGVAPVGGAQVGTCGGRVSPSPRDFAPPGPSHRGTPYGGHPGGKAEEERQWARARAQALGDRVHDVEASGRYQRLESIVSQWSSRTTGSERGEGLAALADLVGQGLPLEDGVSGAFRLLWGRPSLLGGRGVRELHNAARMLRRCRPDPWAVLGGPDADHVAATIFALMWDYAIAQETGAAWAELVPHSAAFFVRQLRHQARKERGTWRAHFGAAGDRRPVYAQRRRLQPPTPENDV
jgi:hypothetical protein